jgi:hypothetical protein
VVAATPLADSMPSDHDSPNAPATARSVYVIAHTAARPLRLVPRFWGVTAADPEGSRAMGLVGGLTAAGIGNLAH